METESSDRKHLELEVSDFGPIARAKVELRPLTVFVGPSNMGKSYLAILIYALHRFFRNNLYNLAANSNSFLNLERPFFSMLSAGEAERIQSWAVQNVEEIVGEDNDSMIIPPDITRFVWEKIALLRGSLLNSEITRCFGIDSQALKRHHSSAYSQINVRLNLPETIEAPDVNFCFELKGDSTSFLRHSIDSLKINGELYRSAASELYPMIRSHYDIKPTSDQWSEILTSLLSPRLTGVDRIKHEAERFISTIATAIIQQGMHPLISKAPTPISDEALAPVVGSELPRLPWIDPDSSFYYLPAARTGVIHAHQVVVSSLIRNATTAGIRQESSIPILSGVLADFLERLVRLPSTSIEHQPSVGNLANEIEKHLLKGEINVENKVTNYPGFSYRPSGWQNALPLMNTSSMISDLAPIVLYLRYVVRIGDTLIIEEPEAHLHPAMQREFTRQIVAMVHAGIRVVITTHSEWVLEELANLVYLSQVPKDRAADFEGAPLALEPDQVGVWLFEAKKRPRGSVVREIPLDTEMGSFDSGFAEVMESLYSTWAKLTRAAQADSE